jgi:hypothetical protein
MQRVEISSVTNKMRRVLEKLPKVTLDEIWRSINKRILAFEHYELLQHFNSERMFMEYLSLVEVQQRTGDKIDMDIIQDESRWQSLSYALIYQGDDVKRSHISTHERRVEPYRESDDAWVDPIWTKPAYIGNVTLEEEDVEQKEITSHCEEEAV